MVVSVLFWETGSRRNNTVIILGEMLQNALGSGFGKSLDGMAKVSSSYFWSSLLRNSLTVTSQIKKNPSLKLYFQEEEKKNPCNSDCRMVWILWKYTELDPTYCKLFFFCIGLSKSCLYISTVTITLIVVLCLKTVQIHHTTPVNFLSDCLPGFLIISSGINKLAC